MINWSLLALFISLFFTQASFGKELDSTKYFERAKGYYRQGKYEKCVDLISEQRDKFSAWKAARVLEDICKEWIELSKSGKKHPDEKAIENKIDDINRLVQSNLVCEDQRDCLVVAPEGCGGYRYYHWAVSKKNGSLEEIQLLVNNLWKSAAWKTGKDFFTCEAKAHDIYCKDKKCSE